MVFPIKVKETPPGPLPRLRLRHHTGNCVLWFDHKCKADSTRRLFAFGEKLDNKLDQFGREEEAFETFFMQVVKESPVWDLWIMKIISNLEYYTYSYTRYIPRLAKDINFINLRLYTLFPLL